MRCVRESICRAKWVSWVQCTNMPPRALLQHMHGTTCGQLWQRLSLATAVQWLATPVQLPLLLSCPIAQAQRGDGKRAIWLLLALRSCHNPQMLPCRPVLQQPEGHDPLEPCACSGAIKGESACSPTGTVDQSIGILPSPIIRCHISLPGRRPRVELGSVPGSVTPTPLHAWRSVCESGHGRST